MRKLILAATAGAALALSGLGCAHEMHQQSADYHHRQAKRDARELHLGDAAREEHKANVEQRRADDTRY